MYNSNLYFDIETTGLSAYKSHITVIGTAYLKDEEIIFKQFICENPAHECETIAEFVSYASSFKGITHFNGKTFDIPYIKHKCSFFGLDDPFENKESEDLFINAKKLAPLFSMSSMKQKDFECLFSYPRTDRISGKECIDAYKAYMMTGEDKHLDLILLHNKDDVLGMVHIKKNLDIINRMITKSHADASFQVFDDHILINCKCQDASIINILTSVSFNFDESFIDLHLSIKKNIIRITIPKLELNLKHFYKDYKNYFYLPVEGRAIHKSVAQFVDSAYKEKAKKDTAFEPLASVFIPQPETIIEPEFKNCSNDKLSFFRESDLSNANISALLDSYLKTFICKKKNS